jgi:uncharacterized membrane protein YeiH
MILSKFIVQWLEWIIEIGLWLFLVACLVSGFSMGSGFFGSIFMALISLLFGGIVSALMFGFFIVLIDIRRILKDAIESDPGSDNESTPAA